MLKLHMIILFESLGLSSVHNLNMILPV